MSAIQADIEARLADVEPDVEVLLAEVVGGRLVRVFIDHPDGVSLDLCERVTGHLPEVRERYALEVSSPGAERPLTKPEHFRRFLGRKVKVRTEEAIAGRRNFTGTLTEADEQTVSLDADGDDIRIPLAGIRRSNLIPDFGGSA
jgi:ribosome maturation factor RimP